MHATGQQDVDVRLPGHRASGEQQSAHAWQACVLESPAIGDASGIRGMAPHTQNLCAHVCALVPALRNRAMRAPWSAAPSAPIPTLPVPSPCMPTPVAPPSAPGPRRPAVKRIGTADDLRRCLESASMQSFMAFILSLNEAVQVGSQVATALQSPCSIIGAALLSMQVTQNSRQFQEQAAMLKAGTGGARGNRCQHSLSYTCAQSNQQK